MDQRSLIRAAGRIHEELIRVESASAPIVLPAEAWHECQSLVSWLDSCRHRGWFVATDMLQERLQATSARLVASLERLQQQIQLDRRRPRLQTPREIFNDLRGLSGEFGKMTLDLQGRTLSVVTDSIELEDRDLGPFEIRLHWPSLGDRRPYTVAALDPNPASTSRETTHPHVQSEQLCEGAGAAAIEQALCCGRLFDFFQVVNRILHTYNSGSAYVPLANWSGTVCNSCGDGICEDGEFACDRCGDALCRDCLTACECCDRLCCHACFNYCRACEAVLCSGCQQVCSGCERRFCVKCLSESNRCPECQDDEQPESADHDEVQTPADLPPSLAAATGDASAGPATPSAV